MAEAPSHPRESRHERPEGGCPTLVAIDIAEVRANIRRNLTFRHEPLEGKGRSRDHGLTNWDRSPFRSVVEELLIGYWERSARLHELTIEGDMLRLQNFLRFLDNLPTKFEGGRRIYSLKDLSFNLLREYERWLSERPLISQSNFTSKMTELHDALKHDLPHRRGCSVPTINLSALGEIIGVSGNYISRHSEFWRAISEVAIRQGLRMPKRRAPIAAPASTSPSDRVALGTQAKLATGTVAEIYHTLTKILRHIARHRRHLLSDDFILAELTEPERQELRVKSAALSPAEQQNVEAACLSAIRRIRKRLLVDGPARAGRGHQDPLPSQSEADWGRDLDNMIAYLAAYAPAEVVGQGRGRLSHRRFVNQLTAQRSETGHDLARWLAPDQSDLCPFLIRMACCEYAPLNLSSLLSLHIEPEQPRRHCVRASPTPSHKRIFFGKPRAGIDQTFIDVPSRGDLDMPGIIETVIKITKPLRLRAPKGAENNLWLYLSKNKGIRALSADAAYYALRHFITSESVRGEGGEILQGLHFRRFRPTVIASTSFDSGIEAAQRRAAHSNPIQTLAYVNNPGSEHRVQRIVESAQSRAIASVRAGFSSRPTRGDIDELVSALGVPRGAAAEIIAGQRDKLFNGCIDDLNGLGPEPKGRPCRRYESCLICINSVIIERHLPRLITFYYHWLSLIDEMDLDAWKETHELNCAIVETHLKKFDKALVERIAAQIHAGPLVIGYRRFKQT